MNEYIIPQEINQADRIGKFTITQAGILGLGLLICLLLLSSSSNILISLVISIPIILVTLVCVFVEIKGYPIYEYIGIYVMYISMPKYLIYRSDNIHDDFYDDDEDDGLILIEE